MFHSRGRGWTRDDEHPRHSSAVTVTLLSTLLLRMAQYSVVLVYLGEVVGELVDGDTAMIPRGYVYGAVFFLATWLRRRRASALPLVVTLAGFLASANVLSWLVGIDAALPDSVTSVTVTALLGMLGVVLHDGRTAVMISIAAIFTGATAWATAAVDGLSGDDAVVRTAAAVFVAMLGGWAFRTMRNELQAIIHSKDGFIASVSHELRTPLTGVLGFAETLAHDQDKLTDEEISELVGYVASQSRDVADLVEDLLVAARADLGTLTVQASAMSPAPEVAAVVAASHGRGDIGHPPIGVIGDAPIALADALRCRQVLRNLISNALRYGGEHVTVRLGRTWSSAVIDVLDDGEGLDPAEGDRVFEPYYRARQTMSQPGAVGLGLAVSRQLARMMGGDVIHFREDGYTVFRFTIPRLHPDTAEPHARGAHVAARRLSAIRR